MLVLDGLTVTLILSPLSRSTISTRYSETTSPNLNESGATQLRPMLVEFRKSPVMFTESIFTSRKGQN